MQDLSSLVGRFVQTGADAMRLHREVRRHVERATRRYPDGYFELGRRTDEAVEGLADRVFAVCSQVPKGRFPFSGRAPFPAYVEERFDDAPIRYHSFYAKLSIAREILREDYAYNLRHDPNLRWRDTLHREVGQALARVAEPADDGPAATRRWRSRGRGLRLQRSPEDVRDVLARRQRPEDLDPTVAEALSLLGAPISHSRLSNLLADAWGPPAELQVEEAGRGSGLEERMSIRDAVFEAWTELSQEEQVLVAALARGTPYDALIEAVPAFSNRSAVSRAVKRVGERFVAKVVAAVGGEEASIDVTPKEVMERIVAVLVPMLPELIEEEP